MRNSVTNQYLVVQADWNDGDYITAVSPITDEQLTKFLPLFEKLKVNGHHNWPVEAYNTEEIEKLYGKLGIKFHENFVPVSYESGYVHTIESISLMHKELDIL